MCSTNFNIKLRILLKKFTNKFRMIPRINSDYFNKLYWPTDLCNGDASCFLWRKNWILKYYLEEIPASNG
jgi:hypothetical protein